jgi:rubredoxin
MYPREKCGGKQGKCSEHMVVHFTCPQCGAKHDRGYVDGYSTFRCLRCGYSGTGAPLTTPKADTPPWPHSPNDEAGV